MSSLPIKVKAHLPGGGEREVDVPRDATVEQAKAIILADSKQSAKDFNLRLDATGDVLAVEISKLARCLASPRGKSALTAAGAESQSDGAAEKDDVVEVSLVSKAHSPLSEHGDRARGRASLPGGKAMKRKKGKERKEKSRERRKTAGKKGRDKTGTRDPPERAERASTSSSPLSPSGLGGAGFVRATPSPEVGTAAAKRNTIASFPITLGAAKWRASLMDPSRAATGTPVSPGRAARNQSSSNLGGSVDETASDYIMERQSESENESDGTERSTSGSGVYFNYDYENEEVSLEASMDGAAASDIEDDTSTETESDLEDVAPPKSLEALSPALPPLQRRGSKPLPPLPMTIESGTPEEGIHRRSLAYDSPMTRRLKPLPALPQSPAAQSQVSRTSASLSPTVPRAIEQPSRFPIRLRLTSDEQIVVTCGPTETAETFMSSMLNRIKATFKLPETTFVLGMESGEEVQKEQLIADLVPIRESLSNKRIPILILKGTEMEPPMITHQIALREVPSVVKPPNYLDLILTDGETVRMAYTQKDVLKDIKEALALPNVSSTQLKKLGFRTIEGLSDTFLNEEIPIYPNFLENRCLKESRPPMLLFIEKDPEAMRQEQLLNLVIGNLIGKPLCWTQEQDEVTIFRQSMCRLRFMERQERQRNIQAGGVPIQLSESEIKPNGPLMVILEMPINKVKKTILAKDGETAQELLQRVFSQYYAKHRPEEVPEHYIFKVEGMSDYIDGPYPLHAFKYVRNCYANKEKPNLVLIERSTVVIEQPLAIDDPTDAEELVDPTFHYNHQDITLDSRSWQSLNCISLWDMTRNFRIRVVGVEKLNPNTDSFQKASGKLDISEANVSLYASLGLYHGGSLVAPLGKTSLQTCSRNPRWNEWVEFNIQMQNLPRAARVCFTLWAKAKDRDVALGWVSCQLVDYKHQLKTGLHGLNMWPDEEANPIGTTEGNPAANAMILYVQYDEYPLPVVFPTEPLHPEEFWESIMKNNLRPKEVPLDSDVQMRELAEIIERDALCPVNGEDKKLLWDWRHDLLGIAKSLPKFLLSVAYDDRLAVQELHYLLKQWNRFPTPVDALELLDAKFADALVRQHAVTYLEELSNEELGDYLLQLVQVLKKKMTVIAYKIKETKEDKRKETLQAELEKVSLPPRFQLPLDPDLEAKGIIINRCRYMDSKKLPLWLSFESYNADRSIETIFKAGDDLRQDMLTLQMLRIMDKLWKREGLDLQMSPYRCISTGDQLGMIEVVINASTTAHISKAAAGVKGAFALDPLDNWLKEHNQDEAYRKAVKNFIYSCAGYCVATEAVSYEDLISMRADTNLKPDIDFGHFLGNYKKKLGIKRERAPFVLTPDFAYVMGGKDSADFKTFENLCCQAYNILRKHSHMFINLFAMMLSTGIPELTSSADIFYLRKSLSIDQTDDEAAETFKKLILQSLSTKTTQFNFAVHMVFH